MTAGYSGTALLKKLGVKPNMRMALLSPPPDFDGLLGSLPRGVSLTSDLSDAPYDYIHFFTANKRELEQSFLELKTALKNTGILWISWPKKAVKMKVKTDLNENRIRDIGLQVGLVDVKVCAIDDVWSALKFVYRLRDRKH